MLQHQCVCCTENNSMIKKNKKKTKEQQYGHQPIWVSKWLKIVRLWKLEVLGMPKQMYFSYILILIFK